MFIEEFRREIQIRNLYKFNKSCSYWLRRLENHQRKEPIAVADYTIEHILPQNPELSAPWREALGPDWRARFVCDLILPPGAWLVAN